MQPVPPIMWCSGAQFFCWDCSADFADLDGLICYFDLIHEPNTGALTGWALPSACIHQAFETSSAIILCHWCSFIARLLYGKPHFCNVNAIKIKGACSSTLILNCRHPIYFDTNELGRFYHPDQR